MGRTDVLWHRRVGWWAGGEPADPLAALAGSLLRAEIRARCPGLSPVLVHGATVGWAEPGFTGEPAAVHSTPDGPASPWCPLSVLVASGEPRTGRQQDRPRLGRERARQRWPSPPKKAGAWSRAPAWGRRSPSPSLCCWPPGTCRATSSTPAAPSSGWSRAFPGTTCSSRAACWTARRGQEAEDLELALRRLARAAGGDRPAEVVKLVPGPTGGRRPRGRGPPGGQAGRNRGGPPPARGLGRVTPTGPAWPCGWPTRSTWPRPWRGPRRSWPAAGPDGAGLGAGHSPCGRGRRRQPGQQFRRLDGRRQRPGPGRGRPRGQPSTTSSPAGAGPAGSNDWRLRWTSPSTTLLTTWYKTLAATGPSGRRGHVHAAHVRGGLAGAGPGARGGQ